MFFKKKDGKKKATPKTTAAPARTPSKAKGEEGVMKLSKSEVSELYEEGWIRAFITFELAGKPREHIEQTLRAYLANIKTDGRVKALKEEFADAMEHEDGMWSAYCELEAIVMGMETLTWLAVNFMPAAIEVQEPMKRQYEANQLTAWFNDLLAKLHEVSQLLREERSVKGHLTTAMNALIKNALLVALKNEKQKAGDLEKTLGIPAKQLQPFLDHLVEKEKLTFDKKSKKYALKK